MYAYSARTRTAMHPVNFLCISKMHKYICLAHARATSEFAIAMCPVTSYLRAYLTGGDVAATAVTDQLRQLRRPGRPKNGLRSHQGDVAATAETAETDQSRRLGRPTHGLHSHVAETSPRPGGDWKVSKKIEHVWISRDSLETRLVSRRRRGDVSACSGDPSRHLVAT